uniref:Uncharacterized protein n=1 Tax=Chaetophora lobata TaxID=1249516 RepID=A0A7U1G3D7_9CHLO|nr:hypothetical protein [Chaetophora lobata]
MPPTVNSKESQLTVNSKESQLTVNSKHFFVSSRSASLREERQKNVYYSPSIGSKGDFFSKKKTSSFFLVFCLSSLSEAEREETKKCLLFTVGGTIHLLAGSRKQSRALFFFALSRVTMNSKQFYYSPSRGLIFFS